VPGQVSAKGKHVVVIGGGDTGSDCIGTSIRQGAASVTNFELMPQPPDQENKPLTWPYWPMKLRTSSSHEEGAERDFAVSTKAFLGKDGKVTHLTAAHVEFVRGADGRTTMKEVAKTEFTIPADLVLLAMGYVHPVHEGMVADLGVDRDSRGNVKATTDGKGCYQTSQAGVFAAGDMRRGQSLVVWAIREGRQCARAIDEYLTGSSELPR
jgi:glutamate synthase (NADPH) small chain